MKYRTHSQITKHTMQVLGNLPNIATLNREQISPPMIKSIQLNYQNNLFEVNGLPMTEDDMEFYLGYVGFYVVRPLKNLDLYFKVLASLIQLTDTELNETIIEFLSYSRDEREIIRELIENRRGFVDNPVNN
jgi:hypothetical protein